ncbi:hypothetical protein PsWM33_03020 [Pseudovibrio sp. WM33]|nr:hypothetical protein PsWM33_03020 [Pseudovibrio sp. WM33]
MLAKSPPGRSVPEGYRMSCDVCLPNHTVVVAFDDYDG